MQTFFVPGFSPFSTSYRQLSKYCTGQIEDPNTKIIHCNEHSIGLIPDHTYYTFNMPEMGATLKSNIAGRQDVNLVRDQLIKFLQVHSGTNVMLFGRSRGASSLFIVLSQLQVTQPELLSPVRLVVLEAPFDDLYTIWSRYYLGWIPYIFLGLLHLIYLIGRYVWDFPISPLEVADKYPVHIPTVMVTSVADDTVPHQSTLVLRRGTSSPESIEVVTLNHASHRDYWSHPIDRDVYHDRIKELIEIYTN